MKLLQFQLHRRNHWIYYTLWWQSFIIFFFLSIEQQTPLSHDLWWWLICLFGLCSSLDRTPATCLLEPSHSLFHIGQVWGGKKKQEIFPAGTAALPEYGGFGHSFPFMVSLFNFPSSFLLLKISSFSGVSLVSLWP